MTKFKQQITLVLLFLFCMNPTAASAAYTKEYLMSIGEYQMTPSDITDMADGYRFPQEYHHGQLKHNLPTLGQSVAAGIIFGLVTKNPFIGVGTTVGIVLISAVVEDKLPPPHHYQIITRFETFPTDVPPGYHGAITRVTYEYTEYNSAMLSKENRIGEPVKGVYYGMGY